MAENSGHLVVENGQLGWDQVSMHQHANRLAKIGFWRSELTTDRH